MLISFDKYTLKKQLLVSLAVVIVYVFFGQVAEFLKFEIVHSIPVFYPAGIGFAAAILFGRRILPAVALGAFFTTVITPNYNIDSFFVLMGAAFISASGSFLQALAGISLLKIIKSEQDFLKDVRSTFSFIVVALLMSVVGCSIGATGFWGAGVPLSSPYLTVMFKWWIGDVIGILIGS